jgi:hypothetical protein
VTIARTNPANPLRNVRVIMPGFEATDAASPFHPALLNWLRGFSVLRFMDWMQAGAGLRLLAPVLLPGGPACLCPPSCGWCKPGSTALPRPCWAWLQMRPVPGGQRLASGPCRPRSPPPTPTCMARLQTNHEDLPATWEQRPKLTDRWATCLPRPSCTQRPASGLAPASPSWGGQ